MAAARRTYVGAMGRVLLVAPSVDASDISEAQIGFEWARRLSERHDVTLLTYRDGGRPSARDQLPDTRVVEWTQPAALTPSERFNSTLKPWYPLYYGAARRWLAGALARGERWDVAHQPLPLAMRYPSPLTGMGIPYVLGPLGGSLSTPAGFGGEDTAPWYVGLRNVDAWRFRHDPWLRASLSQAAVVLGIGPYVGDLLRDVPLRRFLTMADTGVTELPEPVAREADHSPVRLLYVGRLVRTKGARDAIAALAHLRDLPVTLDVVGDGFDRVACEELVRTLGLGDVVIFHGALTRPLIDEHYRRADIFVWPSYREPGGAVPFEAMSYGLPMVVCDRGGPAQSVSECCGFKIVPTTPEQYALDIAQAVRRLVENPRLRLEMGRSAREHVAATGTWDAHVARMEEIYAEVAGHAWGSAASR